jgi:DNA recombination protein RmuC
METVILVAVLVTSVLSIVLLVALLMRKPTNEGRQLETVVREDLRNGREEAARAARDLREEISAGQKTSVESLVKTIGEMGTAQAAQLDQVAKQLKGLTDSNETRLEKVRSTLENQMRQLQDGNEKKLEQMRQTVDEKLQNTLEKRLGESFKLVSERLEAVQRGLGEMQSLATGVGDLKRVLSNVKARGTWAEVQLGAILEQILTPDQYAKNVQIREYSRDVIEYAIRLPGTDDSPSSFVWLPIDSKFPQEDYLRLLDASEAGEPEAVQKAVASLLRAVQASAKDISEKYIDPPRTTDFAIMFLPT